MRILKKLSTRRTYFLHDAPSTKLQNYFASLLISDKNSAQTDEEKQRERQRNERELKNAEIEAQNIKVNSISCSIYAKIDFVITHISNHSVNEMLKKLANWTVKFVHKSVITKPNPKSIKKPQKQCRKFTHNSVNTIKARPANVHHQRLHHHQSHQEIQSNVTYCRRPISKRINSTINCCRRPVKQLRKAWERTASVTPPEKYIISSNHPLCPDLNSEIYFQILRIIPAQRHHHKPLQEHRHQQPIIHKQWRVHRYHLR